jgi:hypothetical protein
VISVVARLHVPLDLARKRAIFGAMSQRRRRRRTPTKMDRVPEEAAVSGNAQETTPDELNVQARDGESDAAEAAETSSEAPYRSTDRLPTTDWLDGEPLTTAMISRYFKLTAVMLGLNVVLAGVSVIALFRHPGEPRTIVVAAPPTAPAQPAPLPPPPPSTQAATLPAAAEPSKPTTVTPRAHPATPAPTVEKVPLLGVPSTKRSILASAAAPKRLVVTPAKSTPADSEDEAPGVHLAERW